MQNIVCNKNITTNNKNNNNLQLTTYTSHTTYKKHITQVFPMCTLYCGLCHITLCDSVMYSPLEPHNEMLGYWCLTLGHIYTMPRVR